MSTEANAVNQMETKSSPSKSKNRRRRRKNNKQNRKGQNDSKQMNGKQTNKKQPSPNKSKQQIKTTKTPPMKQKGTTIHSNTKSPWSKLKKSNKLDNIMNEQQVTPNQDFSFTDIPMTDQELLEQQLIFEAIAQSKELQQNGQNKTQQNIQDEVIKQCEEKEKNENMITDEMLAIYLQKQEQQELYRRQKLSERQNGKFAKVTSSSSKSSAIPKDALQFYYDDESMMNGASAMTIDEYKNKTNSNGNDAMVQNVAISKHDAKIWSEQHMQRLNEYETGGDLDANMNIGNQAFNSFRNQLDKKGFVNYQNYRFEERNRKKDRN